MTDSGNMSSSTRTVLILFFCWIALVILLIFLYKKLNREADGAYTIRRLVCKQGGLRDRARSAAWALGSRLGVQLWPRSDAGEDGEEMWEVRDEEAQVKEGKSHGTEEDNVEQCYKTMGGGGDASDDDSSLDSSEAKELIKPEANREMEKRGEGREGGGGDGGGEPRGGPEFLMGLRQFSPSAIWCEEGGVTSDVTSL